MDLSSLVKSAVDEALRERSRVNVLLAGRSGVGKSTLVNAIFQGQFAQTGQGEPVTKQVTEISKPGIPLSILDTRGLELAEYAETLTELERLLRHRRQTPDANQHIHVAWLCIQEPGRRIEEAEIHLHKILATYVPTIAIITKASSDGGFRADVERLLPDVRGVVRVRAIAEQLDDGHRLEALGLEDLVTLTLECVPEGHRRAFVAAQKASVAQKARAAHRVVAGAAAAATAAGASPVPLTDAVLLAPIHLGMIAGITATFGMPVTTGLVTTLVLAATGTGATTYAAAALPANLLKLVPGLGTAAGAVLSSVTAAAVTTAIGEAYIGTLATLFAQTGGEPPGAERVVEHFREKLRGES